MQLNFLHYSPQFIIRICELLINNRILNRFYHNGDINILIFTLY